jgi:hypothetical protein
LTLCVLWLVAWMSFPHEQSQLARFFRNTDGKRRLAILGQPRRREAKVDGRLNLSGGSRRAASEIGMAERTPYRRAS